MSEFPRSRTGRVLVSLLASTGLLATALVGSAAPAGAAQTAPAADSDASIEASGHSNRELLLDPGAEFVEFGETPLHIDTDAGEGASAAETDAVQAAVDEMRAPVDAGGFDLASAGTRYEYPALDLRITLYTDISETVRPQLLALAESAFTAWRSNINLDLPSGQWHEMELGWQSLPNGVLAGAASSTVTYEIDGAAHEVPLTLAESLGLVNSTKFSFIVVFNSNVNWDMSTNPSSGDSRPAIKTTMLHEMGHGLGMTSEFVDANGNFETNHIPSMWDRRLFLDKNLNRPFTSERVTGSGNLWLRNADGTWEKVWSPNPHQPGSSTSHLDEFTYPRETAGALMTPGLDSGEVAVIDGVIVGAMYQVGYRSKIGPGQPSIGASFGSGDINVSITPSSSGAAAPADTWNVQVFNGSTLIDSRSATAAKRTVRLGNSLPAGSYSIRVTPSTDGINGPAATTTLTVTAAQQLAGMTASEAQIYRLYFAAFDRASDKTGFDFWVQRRADGAALIEAANFFVSSQEFNNKYGSLSTAQFVDRVYLNVLKRPADTTGRNYWIGQINAGLSRGGMLIGFSESPEFVSKTATTPPETNQRQAVRRLYAAFFDRQGDKAGLDYWEGRLQQGSSLTTVANAFIGVPEFTNLYGSISNGAFVTLVYQNVLQRNPETSGYNFWVGELNRGVSRGQMMVSFSESPEFRRQTRTH